MLQVLSRSCQNDNSRFFLHPSLHPSLLPSLLNQNVLYSWLVFNLLLNQQWFWTCSLSAPISWDYKHAPPKSSLRSTGDWQAIATTWALATVPSPLTKISLSYLIEHGLIRIISYIPILFSQVKVLEASRSPPFTNINKHGFKAMLFSSLKKIVRRSHGLESRFSWFL